MNLPNVDLEKIANETTLKGLFATQILERLEKCKTEEERKTIERAIEVGLSVLE